jgi:putative ATP-binding cassette transporter
MKSNRKNSPGDQLILIRGRFAMKKIIRMFRYVWHLATPYFLKSEERGKAWALIFADLLAMFVSVAANLKFTNWYADWTNAYVNSDYPLWKQQLILFLVIAASMTIAAACKTYVEGWLKVSWRKWMTGQYLDNWMDNSSHYRMQLAGNVTDNPDQRIQEDINMFIEASITYSLQLLQTVVTLVSYIVVLWNLSAKIPLIFGDKDYSFPGYFIVVALLWAFITTFLVHRVGKHLIRLQYNQQRYEADFRFSLVRVRENSEQIALLKGEPVEHGRLMTIFDGVVNNTFRLIARNMKTLLWNTGLSMLDGLVISIMLGPSYFAGKLPGGYGAIMQIASAFQQVIMAFKFFQTAYVGIATWKAVINRLMDFQINAKKTADIQKNSEVVFKQQDADEIDVKNMDVYLPTGKKQIIANNLVLRRGDKILIKGRTGAGKTTLFRMIAGIWPFGKGTIVLPKNKKIILLPQQPYLPIGTLAEAVCYPQPVDAYKREDIQQALRDVGLGKFVDRLDENAHWNHLMSGGEQQRIGVARALLYDPDYLFFDEATASMDEPSEEELYTMLLQRMKNTTIVSIGHRSSLQKFHNRTIIAEAPNPEATYEFVEQKTNV